MSASTTSLYVICVPG